jgi:hypothetical protein
MAAAFRLLFPVCLVALCGAPLQPSVDALPKFGLDTVLVWKSQNQGETSELVVRIARFLPDRYIEWENATTQGTIYMAAKAVRNAKVYVNASLFEGGVDTKGKNATTLWLSEQLFRELKAKGRVRVALDSVPCWMTVLGAGLMTVTVNRSLMDLPVIKTADERGGERWFLDVDQNPLLVKHLFRSYSESLVSITTDKSNTLRWIKGRKLANPPQAR